MEISTFGIWWRGTPITTNSTIHLQIHTLLQHYITSSIIGNKITCSLHLLQMQISTTGNPLLLSHMKFGHLAPPSWLSSYWESIGNYPKPLFLNFDSIPLPCQFDDTIMAFLPHHLPSPSLLTSINRCQCYLHIFSFYLI